MSSSPPKRRKTSPSTSIPVDASTTNQRPESRDASHSPTKRASFQSPTKASLSRSHPDVLSKVLSRSPEKTARKRSGSGIGDGDGDRRSSVEARAFGLRDRKALRPSLSEPADNPPDSRPSATATEPRRRESSLGFVAPPRRLSRPSTSHTSPDPSQRTTLSPLAQATGSLEGEAAATRDSEPTRSPDPPILPEVPFEDPDLPPTPTQLGLHPPPRRPKGLFSSSPSSRKEKRNRKHGGGFTPSPLKPKPTKHIGDQRSLPSTGPLFEREQVWERVPEAVKTARKLRDELSAQLGRLKQDIEQLENEAQRSERPNDYPVPNRAAVDNLTSLLTTTNPSCAPPPETPAHLPISSILATLLPFSSAHASTLPPTDQARSPSPPPDNPFSLQQPADLTPYLKIFAPLSLDTHTSISKPSISTNSPTATLTQTHMLTLSAPAPFSPQSYKVPITLHTNAETQSILSISIPDRKTGIGSQPGPTAAPNIPTPLLTWMESRLKNPLLKHDISGLCWGVCRYWEAKVSRARIWATLSSKFNNIISTSGPNTRPRSSLSEGMETQSLDSSTTTTNLRNLLPHLERTSMLFSSPSDRPKTETRLLLSCSLILDDWTSEPELQLDICLSRSSSGTNTSHGGGSGYARIEREAKSLFHSLLTWSEGGEGPDASSIIRAVEGVLGVVFGAEGIEVTGGRKGVKRPKDKENIRATKWR